MSKPEEQENEGKARVQVGNLPQHEKELQDEEAEQILGGGGRIGGVIGQISEETAQ